ncbi:hypothetical protein H8K90_09420 [Winogradskyella echinorum]|uniref:GLPGLI family protein n=1 Tax=Winogradskyella echinorum TaxID=538189 RepID=A0ABR6Y1H4_9FLAO|nr:hypothetical protein [Winogradskyella echinorum]MBC3846597.1 hypothetical protein [Winogradskyella echinorum]MBC5750945.1 hypothetical protein [Winogradskyella echinorum]
MRINKNILLVVLVFSFSSFTTEKNFKDYYYQIANKVEIKIYKYIDKNNPSRHEYWKVTTNPNLNKIITESYTTDFRLYNYFEEELKSDGAELIRYEDFEKDSKEEIINIVGKVIDKDVFKWKDTNSYKYSVKYNNPNYGNAHFTKERIKNSFENIYVRGKEYSTLMFKDKYIIKLLDANQQYEYYQFTYYAKGVGMVEYQRYLPDGTVVELELAEFILEDDFNKLIKNSNK